MSGAHELLQGHTADPGRSRPSDHARVELPHAVTFYETDETLCDIASDFLATGLAVGHGVLAIATEPHRRAFSARLAAKGLDVDRAVDERRLVLLDADETLAEFMLGEMPDWKLFERTVGPRLQQAASWNGQVCAYGEMVDLLWRRGQHAAAIRLEEMWNDLQQVHPFSLLCAYVVASFYKQQGHLHHVCEPHTHVEIGAGTASPEETRALAVEIAQRKEVERALRDSLRQVRRQEETLRQKEKELRDFFENAPVALHWIGADGRIIWANRAELDLLGYHHDEYVGQPIADFHLDAAEAESLLTRLARREEIRNHEARLRAKDGSTKHVLISSNVCWDGDAFLHTRCFTIDVTGRKAAETLQAAQSARTERLRQVTTAIAEAVTAEQVFEALVDQVAAALSASSVALFLVRTGEPVARLVRATGYSDAARNLLDRVPLVDGPSIPAIDSIRRGEAIWIASQADLIRDYPHLATMVTRDRSYSMACLPIATHGRTQGAVALTFDDSRALDGEERALLLLIARYSGQALERLRLLEAEHESRGRAEILYGLVRSVISADRMETVFDAALDTIERALGTNRASILVFDPEGTMRFRAWRGLSDGYRAAVDGHSPWMPDASDPQMIMVSDVEADPSMSTLRSALHGEGIGALGFVPLVSAGRLLGKFMVYYPGPRTLDVHERALARAIADHIAAAISLFRSMEQLQETVRFNELSPASSATTFVTLSARSFLRRAWR